MSKKKRPDRQKIRQRSKQLRRAISAMDFVVSGTLHSRTKVCGKPNCRCADDPAARHGPYHEWSRRKDGRLVHSIVSEDQAKLIAHAIDNHRQVKELLAQWEALSAEEVLRPGSSAAAQPDEGIAKKTR